MTAGAPACSIVPMCVHPLAAVAALAVLLLSSAPLADAHAMQPAPGEGARQAMREAVRLGQLHACVSDQVEPGTERPVLRLRNECDMRVSVTLCLRGTGQDVPDYYTPLIPPRSDARQQLLVRTGTGFSYRYNTCLKELCTAPRPEC